ncbi:MAG: hypothetical protein AVDCRST_MAG71-2799 [uncultured Lysobacter sp.]|uniref:SPOR domain-containing protein n=1 Tax=uncultured Lysobacter sp. TaxID=271060 RepID=A0A6J4M6F9_9GAMM|nr:MAG: hypothetical protein AVDCRST_MAG71-2799 [uncultured Lysobacter sp.]
MLPRALLVFLLVLNLGVGLWWWLGASTPASVAMAAGTQVPELQLASEQPAGSASPAPAVAPLGGTAPLPADAACISLGPFADATAAAAVATRITAIRTRVAARASGRVRGWRVFVPPQSSPEAAQALGARIAAAGFADYFVMRTGADTNAIALGRFQSEQAARRHAAAVAAAGFPARAEAVGGGPTVTWLDLALAPDADPDAVQAAASVTEQRPIDCQMLQ